MYQQAKLINRYELDNETIPTQPYITEQMEADIMDIFDTIKILLSTLGFPVFEGLPKPKSESEILICKGKEAHATGEYTDEGMVVFQGSIANVEETKTAGKGIKNMRNKLLNSGVLVQEGNVYVFTSDYIFNSPSAAAGVVLGRRANGWREWKNQNDQTLDELKRQ